MAFKFIAVLACVAVTSARLLPVQRVYYQHSPPHPIYAHTQPIRAHHEAQYNFAYEVHDEHTGDIKIHSESRNGDVVHGEYSLIDPDGFRRVVQYTVDPHSGFNAVVTRIPLKQSMKIVKQGNPVVYVAPAHHTAIVDRLPGIDLR